MTLKHTVRRGTARVEGRLDPDVVQRVVYGAIVPLHRCYDDGLSADPALAGMVVTKLVIDSRGAVMSATRDPSTTMTNATLVSCVAHVFSTLTFPAPDIGTATVVFPLTFAP